MTNTKRYKHEWRNEHGQLVTTTYVRADSERTALALALKQVFAKRYNPYHLSFRCFLLGDSVERVQKRPRKKVDISTEFDAQKDFWWNKD
jgi:hypothetical protein